MSKIKGLLSIFSMSLTFFMMIETRYINALGDYVLEAIGVKVWSGDNTGLHLTVIYLGIAFIVFLFFTRKYAIEKLGMRKRIIFLLFIILMIIFTSITNLSVRNIKKHSDGLLAIGYEYKNSNISYSCFNGEYVDFIAEFKLTNYSDDKKTFYISIDNPHDKKEGIDVIQFYVNNDIEASFELEGHETKEFVLTSDKYEIKGGKRFNNGGRDGIIQELILSDDIGNKVKLDKRFFGVEIVR